MLTDSVTNEDTGSSRLVTDDSCTVQCIEIAPLTRDTGDPCTTECGSGDRSDDAKQEYLAVVKQEPHDVHVRDVLVLFIKCLIQCT